ncbi:MAG: MlaD family protein [bacterium]
MNRNVRDFLVVAFVLLGIAALLFAFFWFSGRIEGGRRRPVVVHFPDATGLRTGDPVEVLGLYHGRVGKLALDGERVRCEILLNREVTLRVDSRFAIRSVSYLGSDRRVMVMPGHGQVAEDGHEFEGLNEALDLEETFLRVDRMMERLDPEQLSDELRKAGQEVVEAIGLELGRLNASLDGLNRGFSGATAEISAVAGRLDSLSRLFDESSTAGRLLSSDELYRELLETNEALNALLLDVRQQPRRYFKFSLF